MDGEPTQQAVEHRTDGGIVAEQFAPVFDGPVGSEKRAGALVTSHHDFEQIACTPCVCRQLGVGTTSVFAGKPTPLAPTSSYMPAVIRFLGYNPLPPPSTMGERLVRRRAPLGLTQKESAGRLGVDPCTLARWERGELESKGDLLKRVALFLYKGAKVLDSRLAG